MQLFGSLLLRSFTLPMSEEGQGVILELCWARSVLEIHFRRTSTSKCTVRHVCANELGAGLAWETVANLNNFFLRL